MRNKYANKPNRYITKTKMSNYYKSNCCGEQVETCRDYEGKYDCQKCHKCCEVTSVIDSPGGGTIPEDNNIKKLTRDCDSEAFLDDLTDKINELINFINDDSGFNQEIDELQPDYKINEITPYVKAALAKQKEEILNKISEVYKDRSGKSYLPNGEETEGWIEIPMVETKKLKDLINKLK